MLNPNDKNNDAFYDFILDTYSVMFWINDQNAYAVTQVFIEV